AGIINGQRSRKEAIADDFVGCAWMEGYECGAEPEKTRAQDTVRHSISPQLPDKRWFRGQTAARSHRQWRSSGLGAGARARQRVTRREFGPGHGRGLAVRNRERD